MSSPGPVVVLGAGGFVGRHLVEHLRTAGVEVRVPQLADGRRVDIAGSPELLLESIGDARVIVNAAGRAHIHSADPSVFWPSNAIGARNIARAAAQAPSVVRLVQVSSVAVGAGGLEPHVTDAQPYTAYGASKAAGELAIAAELAGSNVDLVIIRPAGIGGIDSPGAWGQIRRLIEADRRVPVPANQVRHDVVEIEDVTEFLATSITDAVSPGVYSLAGPTPATLEEYAERVGAMIGKNPRVVRVPNWLLRSALSSTNAAERSIQPARRISGVLTTMTRQRDLVRHDPVA
jgi:UDP-glucose 4-epimerase